MQKKKKEIPKRKLSFSLPRFYFVTVSFKDHVIFRKNSHLFLRLMNH